IQRGNAESHAIGLGQMNLHGYLAREGVQYGSPEALDFVSAYFAAVAYHAVHASNRLAIERGRTFVGFEDSAYASGEYFTKYLDRSWAPTTASGRRLFADAGIDVPSQADWTELAESVRRHGL